MLADYRLDTELFSDMMDEARNMAVSLYPDWTDFNYHDPGITMLELFAWIKEGQQYFLDQIGTEHKKKYLKLLGMALRHRTAARASVFLETQKDFALLKGTRFYAQDVVFETAHRQSIICNALTACFHARNGLEHDCAGERPGYQEGLQLPVFGLQPQRGDAWYLGFAQALPQRETIGISIHLAKLLDGLRRAPLQGPLYAPMLRLCYEYFAEDGWHKIEKLTDETYGMLADGMLYLAVEKKMQQAELYGKRAYYIRIRVEESDIDFPPVLESIRINAALLIQTDTWICSEEKTAQERDGKYMVSTDSWLGVTGTNELYLKSGELYYPLASVEKYIRQEEGKAELLFRLPERFSGTDLEQKILIVSRAGHAGLRCPGIGNGLPEQDYELPFREALQESIEILVQETGGQGGYARWQRVEDFGASLPQDKHFTADTQEGRISFGDCIHGMAPEGEIRLISAARTLGREGNVKKRKICRLVRETETEEPIQVFQDEDAAGGKDEESLESCFQRAKREFRHPDTAVSYADYERLIKETPGLVITACRAVPAGKMHMIQENSAENKLVFVVQSGGKNGLSLSYRRNILAHLEPYRLLGTSIRLIAPCQIPLEVYLDVTVKPHYHNAKEQIRQAVEHYFQELSGSFGAVIVYSGLYGRIDMLACVAAVNDMTLDVKDSRVQAAEDGNLILPPNGMAQLIQVHPAVSFAV